MRFVLLALATVTFVAATASALVPRLGNNRTTTVRFSKREQAVIDTHKGRATFGVSFSATISGRQWQNVSGVRVFLNLPTADFRTPIKSLHYVGTFVPYPAGGREARVIRSSNAMSLVRTVNALRAAGVALDLHRPLSVTLVPIRNGGAPADVIVTITAINLYASPPAFGWSWWSSLDQELTGPALWKRLAGKYDATEMIATMPNTYLPSR